LEKFASLFPCRARRSLAEIPAWKKFLPPDTQKKFLRFVKNLFDRRRRFRKF